MNNVRLWKKNSIIYAERHKQTLENPNTNSEPNYNSDQKVEELCN